MIGATIAMAFAAPEAELAYRCGQRGRPELERRPGGWPVIVAAIGASSGFVHLSATWIFG